MAAGVPARRSPCRLLILHACWPPLVRSFQVGPELEIPGYGCEDHFNEHDTVEHSWVRTADTAQPCRLACNQWPLLDAAAPSKLPRMHCRSAAAGVHSGAAAGRAHRRHCVRRGHARHAPRCALQLQVGACCLVLAGSSPRCCLHCLRHAHCAPRSAFQLQVGAAGGYAAETLLRVPLVRACFGCAMHGRPAGHVSTAAAAPLPLVRVFLLNRRVLLIRPKLHLANDGNYRCAGCWRRAWLHLGRERYGLSTAACGILSAKHGMSDSCRSVNLRSQMPVPVPCFAVRHATLPPGSGGGSGRSTRCRAMWRR